MEQTGTLKTDERKIVEVNAADFPIGAATVYTDRAEVTRTIRHKLTKGFNELRLVGPGPLEQDSIRVSGVGAATIVDVRFEVKHVPIEDVDKEAQSELDAAKAQHRELQSKIRRLTNQQQALNEQQNSLQQFATDVIASPSARVSAAPAAEASTTANAWESQASIFYGSVSEQYLEAGTKIAVELVELGMTLEDLNEESRLLENKIMTLGGKITGKRTEECNIVYVTLSATEAQTVTVTVSYMVNNASWVPNYDIRVSSEKESLELTYMARISQSTSEDWNNATLTLSTAHASVSGDMETLTQPWNLRIYNPEPARKLKTSVTNMYSDQAPPFASSAVAFGSMATDNMPMVGMAPMMMAAPAPPVIKRAVAQAKASLTSTSFQIPARNTIPSDGVEHKVTVAILELKPGFSYTTLPRLSGHAFLKAEVKNTSDYALLQGLCAIYLDGSFVSKTNLEKTVSPLEVFEISLGVDPGIAVTYGALKKQQSESGNSLMGNRTTILKYARVITIKNTKRIPISIHLREQIPMSQDDKIKVSLVEPVASSITAVPSEDAVVQGASNKSIVLYQDMNVLDFSLSLVAGETKGVAIRFEVVHPEKESVQGLYD
eukprot:jgi/Hompol1/5545/HPOL_004525-RA